MAKTYEALLKVKMASGEKATLSPKPAKTIQELPKPEAVPKKDVLPSSFVSSWQCADLKSTKEIGDLSQKIALDTTNKVFHFLSSRKSEGTSTIVINLAKFMMNEKSFGDILLIDANLHHPVLHSAFNVPPSPGLREALTNDIDYSDVIYRVGTSNVNIIPSGTPFSSDTLNIAQNDFSALISSIRDRYQHILIDSPPFFASSDSIAVALSSDVTSLIIRAHTTEWEVAEKAKAILNENHCTIVGIILNRVQHVIPEWVYKRL